MIDKQISEKTEEIIKSIQKQTLREVRQKIIEMYTDYTDVKGYALIRKSDVLNFFDRYIREIE